MLRDLILLLAVTSGGLLAAVFYAGATLRDDLAREQLSELAGGTGERFAGFFQPVEQTLHMAAGWGRGGDLRLDDDEALAQRFIPVLDALAEASALVIGDATGRSFYLRREADAWISRQVAENGDSVQRRWNGQGEPTHTETGRSDFDPRTRPWFQGALSAPEREPLFWTRPYLFFTERVPGVTAALAYRDPARPGAPYVIGIDLPLQHVLAAVSRLTVGMHGQAFLLEADGAVLLPHPHDRPPADGIPVSLHPREFDAGPVFDAVRAWRSAQRPAGRPLPFHSGAAWWTWLRPLGREDGIWLGIAVPETDFLGALRSGWRLVLLVGLCVLGAGLWLTFSLTRHYARQFRALPAFDADPGEFERKILGLIRHGEGPTVEFKSTLRTNLQTGKPGKEIELAWLKGVVAFLNTDGGVLLIGVSDDGTVLGLDADGFENDDKCLLHFKNLINQHVGAECSKYIQAQLRTAQGRQVLVVSCEKAAEPVFLTVGKNEEFHIRSGPSSMKLTPRQMLQYLS